MIRFVFIEIFPASVAYCIGGGGWGGEVGDGSLMVDVLKTVNPILRKSLRIVLEIVGIFLSIIYLNVYISTLKKKEIHKTFYDQNFVLNQRNNCQDHILSSTGQCLKSGNKNVTVFAYRQI